MSKRILSYILVLSLLAVVPFLTAEAAGAVPELACTVKIPDRLTVGDFNEIEILLKSAEDSATVLALDEYFQQNGISPELRIELLEVALNGASAEREADAGVAAKIVEKFRGSKSAVADTAYPLVFKQGMLGRNWSEGGYYWISIDGRKAGIRPLSPGSYRIKAELKMSDRLITIDTEEFEVSGEGEISMTFGLPPLYAATIEILDGFGGYSVTPDTVKIIREALAAGQESAAVRQLGRAMREALTAAPAQTVGRYVAALVSEVEVGNLLPFLRDFFSAYGQGGVLIVTKSGIVEWSAISKGGSVLKAAPEGPIAADGRYIVIPFESGGDFELAISGSGQGDTLLWKIVPEGVNTKHYPAGRWDKEIAVYTSVVLPPQ